MTTPDAPAPAANDPLPEPDERARRPEPARTGPDRSSATVLLPSAGETVDAGVNTAYRVLGDYLRRGQEAAQKQGASADDRTNPWMAGGPWAAGMMAVPLQMFRAWAQLAGTWADLSMIPGAGEGVRQMTKLVEELWATAGVGAGPAGGQAPATAKPAIQPAALRFAIEAASAQPVEIDVEFDPPAGVVPMVQRLHPLRGEAPPLTALEFEYDPSRGRAKLSIAIPANQAPGRYVGTIFDDRDDRACGTVEVRVGD